MSTTSAIKSLAMSSFVILVVLLNDDFCKADESPFHVSADSFYFETNPNSYDDGIRVLKQDG